MEKPKSIKKNVLDAGSVSFSAQKKPFNWFFKSGKYTFPSKKNRIAVCDRE